MGEAVLWCRFRRSRRSALRAPRSLVPPVSTRFSSNSGPDWPPHQVGGRIQLTFSTNPRSTLRIIRKQLPIAIFANQDGGFQDMKNLKDRHFHKCLEKAGLRRIRFHDLRHTFSSILIQNGEPLTYVKEQLGHSSIKITVDVYGHLVPGSNRQAVNRLPCLVPPLNLGLRG